MLKERAEKLLNYKLRVFYHPSFDDPAERKKIKGDMPEMEKYVRDTNRVREQRQKAAPEMLPCYAAPLLTAQQEQHLFRQMNYYKWRAKKLMEHLTPNRVGESRIKRIEDYIAKAEEIRNMIASSNFRLATQIGRGVTTHRDCLNDAYLDVLKAVDYFDFTRGNKFSTYCTWVMRKNFYREVKNQARNKDRFPNMEDGQQALIESRGNGYEEEKTAANNTKLIHKLINLLKDERQVFILENYFGVRGVDRKHTLEEISNQIGITKERVRQLKERGLSFIQKKAEELGITADTEV